MLDNKTFLKDIEQSIYFIIINISSNSDSNIVPNLNTANINTNIHIYKHKNGMIFEWMISDIFDTYQVKKTNK